MMFFNLFVIFASVLGPSTVSVDSSTLEFSFAVPDSTTIYGHTCSCALQQVSDLIRATCDEVHSCEIVLANEQESVTTLWPVQLNVTGERTSFSLREHRIIIPVLVLSAICVVVLLIKIYVGKSGSSAAKSSTTTLQKP